MWTNHSWMGGMWIFPVIMAVIVILILVFFSNGRYRFPWFSGNQEFYRDNKKDKPSDILKKRYAKGEINKEEFDRIKHDIV